MACHRLIRLAYFGSLLLRLPPTIQSVFVSAAAHAHLDWCVCWHQGQQSDSYKNKMQSTSLQRSHFTTSYANARQLSYSFSISLIPMITHQFIESCRKCQEKNLRSYLNMSRLFILILCFHQQDRLAMGIEYGMPWKDIQVSQYILFWSQRVIVEMKRHCCLGFY